MYLSDELIASLQAAEDEYEIVGSCYCELLKYISDTDVSFITRIGHLEMDAEYSQYAESFRDLWHSILKIISQIKGNFEELGLDIEEVVERLLDKLKTFDCPDGMQEKVCISIGMIHILGAIDWYIEKDLNEKGACFCTVYGPLNKGKSTRDCLVYFQERSSFFSGAYHRDKQDSFRVPLRPTRIGAMFKALLMIPTNQLQNIPRIIPVSADECFEKMEDKKLYIASIPYIGFKTFQFCSYGKSHKLPQKGSDIESAGTSTNKKDDDISGPFYVKYWEEAEEENKCRILALLKKAIVKGANIIVFPEFIMSSGMKDAIQMYLKQLDMAERKRLMLVFAGTHYAWDGKRGNNIIYIFSAFGDELGQHYKYSPFLMQSEERIHSADLGGKDKTVTFYGMEEGAQDIEYVWRQYCKNCEILSDPGKECTMIDLEGVGRILPAICRDVIDGEYVIHLANLFMPSMLIVPAWSRSVNSFDIRLSSLAATIHTASLLCNCCNAVGRQNDLIGKFYMPQKQESYMKAQKIELKREGCVGSCEEHGGCIMMIEVDFSEGVPFGKLDKVYYANEKDCS